MFRRGEEREGEEGREVAALRPSTCASPAGAVSAASQAAACGTTSTECVVVVVAVVVAFNLAAARVN